MTTDYPQDAIDRVLDKPGAGRAIRPDDAERIYHAAGCPSMIIHTDVAQALARGLEAQRQLAEAKALLADAHAEIQTKADQYTADAQSNRTGTVSAHDIRSAAKANAYSHAAALLGSALQRAGLA